MSTQELPSELPAKGRRHSDDGPREPVLDEVEPWKDPAASMSLLTELLFNPLDASYREEASHEPPTGARLVGSKIIVLVVALALGLGATVAVRSLRSPASQGTQVQNSLRHQVTQKQQVVTDLETSNGELSAQIREISSAAPGAVEDDFTLDLVNATVDVTGPGATVSLSDAADSAVDDVSQNRRVRDGDLRLVVNALWEAGAEAISVNDQRIGPGTTIRTAGDTILVALEPVGSPYVVRAIGDPDALTSAMAKGTIGPYLSTQTSTFGIGLDVKKSDSISMVGTDLRQTRIVAPAEDGKDAN